MAFRQEKLRLATAWHRLSGLVLGWSDLTKNVGHFPCCAKLLYRTPILKFQVLMWLFNYVAGHQKIQQKISKKIYF